MRFCILALWVGSLVGCVVVAPVPTVEPVPSGPPSAAPSLLLQTPPSVAQGATLRVEPAFPCGDEPAVVVGAGFRPGKVSLEFQAESSRHNILDTEAREVTVEADGTFRYAFRQEDPALAMLRPKARTWVRAYEVGAQRPEMAPEWGQLAQVPLPVCAPDLQAALEATSLPIEEVAWGQMTFEEPSPPPEMHVDTAVIQSREELALALERNGYLASVVDHIPQLDFSRQTGLISFVRLPVRSARPEVVAVAPHGAELVVHTVAWHIPSILLQEQTFHYVAISKSDRSLRFAPLAEGWSTQRNLLQPALSNRRPLVVRVDHRTGKIETIASHW